MRVNDFLREAAERLTRVGVDNGALEARLLTEHCLGMTHSDLVLAARRQLTSGELADLNALLACRLTRIPLSYLTGEREFWSLPFRVTPAVLIPRPETEFLLESALAAAQDLPPQGVLIDLCCGSGVVAVVLARELAGSRRVVAVDLSPAALEVARANAARLGVAERIDWIAADLDTAFAAETRWALVVSNPPYIASGEMDELPPEVRDHEPRLALDGGGDGLAVIRRLLERAARALLPGGRLFCEIGAGQEREVLDLAASLLRPADHFVPAEVRRDWSGRPRVLCVQRCPMPRSEDG